MGIIDDIKSIYCDDAKVIRNHQIFSVILILYLFFYYLLDSHKMDTQALLLQIAFEIILAGYLFSYLSNILHKNITGMPGIKEFCLKKALVVFGLSMLWMFYIIIPLLLIIFIIFILLWITIDLSDLVPLLINFLLLLVLFLGVPALLMKNLIIISYCDNVPAKKLVSPFLIKKLFNSYSSLLLVYTKYFLLFLAVGVIFGIILLILRCLPFDLAILACMALCAGLPLGYILYLAAIFSFPKSLIDIYINEVKPWIYPVNFNPQP